MSVLLPDKVTPFQVKVVPETLLLIFTHELPPSREPKTVSVPVGTALNVAEIVCAAVWVIKSVALDPVSAESSKLLNVIVGAVVSSTYACEANVPLLLGFLTKAFSVLLAASVCPDNDQVYCPTEVDAVDQVVPLSSET